MEVLGAGQVRAVAPRPHQGPDTIETYLHLHGPDLSRMFDEIDIEELSWEWINALLGCLEEWEENHAKPDQ